MPDKKEMGPVTKEFFRLLGESVLIQSVVTLMLISVLCFIILFQVINHEVVDFPAIIVEVTMLVLGFWFGQKTVITGRSATEQMTQRMAPVIAKAAVEAARQVPPPIPTE